MTSKLCFLSQNFDFFSIFSLCSRLQYKHTHRFSLNNQHLCTEILVNSSFSSAQSDTSRVYRCVSNRFNWTVQSFSHWNTDRCSCKILLYSYTVTSEWIHSIRSYSSKKKLVLSINLSKLLSVCHFIWPLKHQMLKQILLNVLIFFALHTIRVSNACVNMYLAVIVTEFQQSRTNETADDSVAWVCVCVWQYSHMIKQLCQTSWWKNTHGKRLSFCLHFINTLRI